MSDCTTKKNASTKNDTSCWLREHQLQFIAYANRMTASYNADRSHLTLKTKHTFRVLRHAKSILSQEASLQQHHLEKPVLLAALYHDIGRYAQFIKYGTFADSLSCNHGILGAKVLIRHNMLSHEPATVRRSVLAAVAMHNRFQIVNKLPSDTHTTLQVLRDADKLDIVHVLHPSLGVGGTPDETLTMHMHNTPGAYSPAVLAALEAGSRASFTQMRYVNDFRLMLCSWYSQLNFPASQKILAQSGYLQSIIDALDGLPAIKDRLHILMAERMNH